MRGRKPESGYGISTETEERPVWFAVNGHALESGTCGGEPTRHRTVFAQSQLGGVVGAGPEKRIDTREWLCSLWPDAFRYVRELVQSGSYLSLIHISEPTRP